MSVALWGKSQFNILETLVKVTENVPKDVIKGLVNSSLKRFVDVLHKQSFHMLKS